MDMQRFVKKKKEKSKNSLTKVFIMQFRELIMRLSYENMNELLKLCKVKSKCSYTVELRTVDLFQKVTVTKHQNSPS